MRRMTNKRTAIFCLVVFAAVIFAGTGFAGEKKETKDKKVNIWTSDHQIDVKTKFDGSFIKGHLGVISEIDQKNKMIVIGDLQFQLAEKVFYFEADGTKADDSEFLPGKMVVYKFDPAKNDKKVFILQVPNDLILKKK